MAAIKGTVTADVVQVRFAFSGKIAKVYKHPGERVKTGDFLAGLDRKELQTILDKELADYEKVRAEFEIFVGNNPNPADDLTKYRKVQIQATLDASVKAVELAKINLDDTDLKSPVNGIVTDNSGIRAGMNITPGSYEYKILDTDSLVIEAETENEKLEKDASVTARVRGEEIKATVIGIIPAVRGKPVARIKPEKTEGLKIGENAEIEL
jgi:multidrug resistance efflux pump